MINPRRKIELDKAILKLARKGVPPKLIGPRLNISRGLVSYRLHKIRRRGEETVPRFDGHARLVALDGGGVIRIARGL